MSQTEKEMLLAVLALGVQNTEACSPELFSRQTELLELLTPDHKKMVKSFYKNGYFVPKGRAWDRFVIDGFKFLDYDLEDDWSEVYHETGFVRAKINKLELDNPDLIRDAWAYIDDFQG